MIPTQPSPLEQMLLEAPVVTLAGDARELDVLRDVLIRRIGTPAQRNSLLRIIKAHAPSSKLIGGRLCSQLGEVYGGDEPGLPTYSSVPAPTATAEDDGGNEDEEDDDE